MSIVLCLSGRVGLDSTLKSFKGQNISSVVSKLGYPTEKGEMLGHTIYRWQTGNPYGLYCNLDLVVNPNDQIDIPQLLGNPKNPLANQFSRDFSPRMIRAGFLDPKSRGI